MSLRISGLGAGGGDAWAAYGKRDLGAGPRAPAGSPPAVVVAVVASGAKRRGKKKKDWFDFDAPGGEDDSALGGWFSSVTGAIKNVASTAAKGAVGAAATKITGGAYNPFATSAGSKPAAVKPSGFGAMSTPAKVGLIGGGALLLVLLFKGGGHRSAAA